MIDDIVFDFAEFIVELPYGVVGGTIVSYSLDGLSYDFESTSTSEISHVFIS